MGFANFAKALRKEGHDVAIWPYAQNVSVIVSAVMRQPEPTILIGYSLGGNSCAWCAKELARHQRNIKLIVAFDPTRNGPPLDHYPLGDHVERAICFRNAGAWAFGGGCLIGEQVEIVEINMFHMFVQSSRYLQDMARTAVNQAVGPAVA